MAEGVILNWTFVPELPAGLSLGDTNGTIYGIPAVNLTQQTFQLRVSSEGGTTLVNFQITINEPIANISYGNGTYIIPRDAMVDIAPTIEGGVVETFEINSTSFPLGLSFNTTNGHFEGVPLLVTNETTYTVWANNSGEHKHRGHNMDCRQWHFPNLPNLGPLPYRWGRHAAHSRTDLGLNTRKLGDISRPPTWPIFRRVKRDHMGEPQRTYKTRPTTQSGRMLPVRKPAT